MPLQQGLDVFRGASYPLRTLRLFFKNPQLLPYLVIPIALNVVIGFVLYWFSLTFSWRVAQGGYDWITKELFMAIATLPQWLQWLDYGAMVLGILFGVILILGVFLFVGVALVQFGVILGAPWYGKLSEKIETIRTGKLQIIEVSLFKDISRAILFEFKKLALILSLSPLLFGINFIPGIGSFISSVGGLCLTGTIICLDFFDSTLERRRLKFRDKLKLIYQALPASGSFAFICVALVSIPIFNLITIPLCIASGTLFVCDRILVTLES